MAKSLKIRDLTSPSTWHGVIVANGHITAIDWHGKKLVGNLSLNGFRQLNSLDVSHNSITKLSLNGCGALTNINASHNQLSQINLMGCTSLTHIAINNNRLTDFVVSEVPALKYLNCSRNFFVDFDARNATSLETLYCQNCRLENLYVYSYLKSDEELGVRENIERIISLKRLQCVIIKQTVKSAGSCIIVH